MVDQSGDQRVPARLWDALTSTIGFPVTNNEIGIVKGLRIATAGANPRLSDPGQKLKLEELGQALLNWRTPLKFAYLDAKRKIRI